MQRVAITFYICNFLVSKNYIIQMSINSHMTIKVYQSPTLGVIQSPKNILFQILQLVR